MKKYIIFFEFVIIFFIVFILLFIILFINISTINFFRTIKDSIFLEFNKLTNLNIRYEKVSPFIIGKINIFEVVLYDSKGLKLELGNIEIHYSILPIFLDHKNPLSIFKKIILKSFDLKINNINDYENIKNLINNLKLNKKKSNYRTFKLKNLIIEIPKGKIHLFNKNNEYLLESDNLKIKFTENIIIDSDINIFLKNNNDTYLKSRINMQGAINNLDNSLKSKFTIDFENIKFIDDTEIKNQRFLFETNNKDFILKRVEDSLPIKFVINKIEENIFTNIDILNLNVKKMFKSDKKNQLFPDILTLKSNLNINFNSLKENFGEIILNSYYDKLLFLNKFNLDFNITLKNKIIYFNKFIINNISNENYIKFVGNFPLYNNDYKLLIIINNFLLPFTKLNTEILINKNNNKINISSSDISINDVIFNNFNINLINNNNYLEIKTIKDINGYSIDGIISKKSNNYLANLKHNFSNFSISNIIKAFNKNYNKKILLNGEFNSEFTKEEFKINNSKFNLFKDDIKSSNLNLELLNNLLYLNYLEINNNDIPLNIYTFINLNKKPLSISINYERNQLNFNINSTISRKNIKMTINNNLIIEYNPIYNFINFNANNFKLPNNNTEVYFNFNFNLNNKTISENNIFIKNINIFKNKTGTLATMMKLNNNNLSFNNIKYIDNSNKIEGEIINDIKIINNSIILKGNGFLKDESKDESYSIDYDIKNNNIDAKLYITHMHINKIIQNNIKGFINSRININGIIKNPEINSEFNLSNGKIGKYDLNVYFIIQKKDQNLNIKKATFQINQNGIYIKNSSIQNLNNNSKSINIEGDLLFKGFQKIFKTNFLITGYFNSLFKNNSFFNIDILFKNLTLGLMQGYNLDKIEKYPDEKLSILKINNIIKVINNGENILLYEKNKNNLIIKSFKENNIILDSTIAVLKDDNISGNIKFTKFPVNIIQKFLLPFVGIDNGLIEGAIILKGKLQHPEFYGKLNAFYGVVSLNDYLQEPIENISGVITADKNRFLVKNVNGKVRNGLAHGYGELLLNGWKLERYEFHINSDKIPALIQKGPVDAKGIGHIEDFIIDGSPKNFNFTGFFVIDEADINLESLLGLNKKEKLKSFPLNVYINFKSGNNVKIIHPIISGIISPDEKVTLKYIGNEAKIYLGGKFNLKKGEVNYLNKKFIIENAEFQFFDDESKINPKVNLRAYYRTRDLKRDTVKIFLTINDRLIPFKTNFYSYPYKSQEDINAMLGFPIFYSENEDNNENFNNNENKVNIDTLADTTDYLSNSLIFTPFENRIRKITRLDTFSMETKFLGNIIKSNYELSSNTLDLLDESSIKLGKYLSNQLYFESMLSFNKRKEYSDLFFLPLNNQNYGLNLQLMLQLELQYFSIGYTFLPKDYYNFYKSNHNISFEAEFKF